MTRNCRFCLLHSRPGSRTGLAIAVVFLLLLPLTLARAGSAGQALQRFEYSLPRMGTVFRIVVYAKDSTQATSSAMAAFERVEQLEQMMSDYRGDSELSFLCKNAFEAPQRVSPELFCVLDRALHFSEISGGAFDVTIGPVVWLWRTARREKRPPSPEEIAAAEKAVGYKNAVLDAGAQTVFLKRRDMKLDLGGIAKGYAADEALSLIRSRGISRALVAGGGDIALGDAPPGKPGWQITIQEPTMQGARVTSALSLHNAGISTSGDANQFLEEGGKRYSHIINPKDGAALQDSASATVIAPDGITADALATTLCIMPAADGLQLAESMKGVSAQVIRRAGGELKRYSTRNFPKTVDADHASKAKSHVSKRGKSPQTSGRDGRAAGTVPSQESSSKGAQT